MKTTKHTHEYPYPEAIDKENIAGMEKAAYNGAIHVIDTIDKAEEAVKKLEKSSIIGFDSETKPCFQKGCRTEVSLLQLCDMTDCYLFRLNITGIPDSLIRLLENHHILKIGLSIKDDFTALRRKRVFEPGGFVELQRLCPAYGIKDASLQKIYAIIFGERISKSQRLSNWEAAELTTSQQLYAALDAWACLRIFKELMLLPAPSPVQFALL
ncbi:3'-5' exonuclease [Porphyromonas pogonae]|uniref:3'-5' exonuclease n=1 Tax=Porphyromonas pogonae TaxID=867595 RepID=UPI002E76B6EA|nr:3'-5' exonuclease [Porphyromonas pogonae]